MRKFQVTVNGNTYEVGVEEIIGNTQTVATPKITPVVSSPVIQNKTGLGAIRIEAPMQGKIVAIKVSEGGKVNKGDVVAVLEAMKMENEIVASEDGTVSTINVAVGQSVEAGDLIASLN